MIREEVKNLAIALYIMLNNIKELKLTGSIALKLHGVELEREFSFGDIDFFYNSINEINDDFVLPPFTKKVEYNADRNWEIMKEQYSLLQYENNNCKIDILNDDNFNFNKIDWFKPVNGNSERFYLSITEVYSIIPNITIEEKEYIKDYINYNFIDWLGYFYLDGIKHIANSKLFILCNHYGYELEHLDIDSLKKDKHYKDLLVINKFLKENPEHKLNPCEFYLSK